MVSEPLHLNALIALIAGSCPGLGAVATFILFLDQAAVPHRRVAPGGPHVAIPWSIASSMGLDILSLVIAVLSLVHTLWGMLTGGH